MPDEPSAHDLLDLPEVSARDRLGDALSVARPDPAAIMGTILMLAAVAVALYLHLGRSNTDPPELVMPLAVVEPTAAVGVDADEARTELVIHAAGAIRSPGLYVLAANDRVADLIEAAGGALPEADLDRVNLAAPLIDGARVFVPRRGEPAPAVVGDASGGATAQLPVDLNTADVRSLETLPGVGPSTAAAIVEHRDRTGPFRSVDDLLEVRGIGPAKLELIRRRVSV